MVHRDAWKRYLRDSESQNEHPARRDCFYRGGSRTLERRAVLKRARPNRFSLVPLPTIELHVRLLEYLAAIGNYFAQFLPMNGSVSYSQSAVSGLVYARGFAQTALSLVR